LTFMRIQGGLGKTENELPFIQEFRLYSHRQGVWKDACKWRQLSLSHDGTDIIFLNQHLTNLFSTFALFPLTFRRPRPYNPLTDEGGGAASDDVLRSREI
jgi:hypothetical protein